MATKARQGGKGSREVTLTLPMVHDFELLATDVAAKLASLCCLGVDQIDEVRIAVIEACINAFEHSRASDHKVDVTFDPRDDQLRIVIEDHGRGIGSGAEASAERRGPDGRKRGFGLRIMREMMDDVQIESSPRGGTRIVMVKKRPKETEGAKG